MSSTASRRGFLKSSVYVAGLVGSGLQVLPRQVLAQAAPATTTPAYEQPSVINLGSNTLSIGPCQAALLKMVEAAPSGGSYAMAESREFQTTLADSLKIPAEYISVYPGSSGPLDLAVTTYVSPERSLVTADPTYEQAWRTAGMRMKAKVIKVPQRADYSHDVQAMCAADPKAGLVYICNPNNPTGAITTHADLEFAAEHKPKGSILLVDEAYIHLSDNAQTAIDLAVSRPDVIVLRTFSKLYGMAGLRLGYAVAHPDTLKKIDLNSNGSVAMTTLVAGTASLRDPELVPGRRRMLGDARRRTVAWLEGQGYTCTKSESNCFMVDIGRDGKAFQSAMATWGVMVGRTWPGFENWPRISVGTEAEMARFREAFTQVMAGKTGPLPPPPPRSPRMALDTRGLGLGQDPELRVC
ncbi:pyridoxal phosphate-dependent aminotransferase [Xanthomonas massiliensis]|uniref:pyridoxal phosphate-dependent aminotransferase n=1 Tax=Xanthomonas massiliensis TaxID=1720302 RepID=UPI00098F3F11|nr:pyridoxal phosphate-dependent aminotransferase [Xanthomonas massiliensis]